MQCFSGYWYPFGWSLFTNWVIKHTYPKPLTLFDQHPFFFSKFNLLVPLFPFIHSSGFFTDPYSYENCIGSTLILSMCVSIRYEQQDGPLRRERFVTLGEEGRPSPFPSPSGFTTLLPVLRSLYPFSSRTSSLLPMVCHRELFCEACFPRDCLVQSTTMK